jgi:HEAT repeat protein
MTMWDTATPFGPIQSEREVQNLRLRTVILAGHAGDADTARAHLADPDPVVRAAAVSALARAEALDAHTLRASLADEHPSVRRRAVEVAAAAGFAPHEVDLTPLLDDPDDRVVEVAAWGLGEQHPPAVAAVEPLCTLVREHADSLVREAAVAALGAIGNSAALDTILAATRDIATVRRRAIIALAPFDGPEVDAALARAVEDRDWQVRQAAEDLLAPPPPD